MKDRCVMCNKESQYESHQNSTNRYGYVDGIGQLCTDCYVSKDVDMNILIQIVLKNPNDMELGEKIRKFYNSKLK